MNEPTKVPPTDRTDWDLIDLGELETFKPYLSDKGKEFLFRFENREAARKLAKWWKEANPDTIHERTIHNLRTARNLHWFSAILFVIGFLIWMIAISLLLK